MLDPSMHHEPAAAPPKRVHDYATAWPTLLGAGLLLASSIAIAESAAPLRAVTGDSVSDALPPAVLGALEALRGVPHGVFFGCFVLATWLPFPIGLFYLAGGIVYGIPTALVGFALALAASNLVLHGVANRLLRPELERFVTRRGFSVPAFDSPLDEALFITLIRLTPGIPYFLQNAILATARVDLVRFVVLSVSIQMIYVTGLVVLGRSAFDGEFGWALAGMAAVVALVVALRAFARRRPRT